VPLPPGIKALQWLQGQPKSLCSPRTYFSSRAPRGDKDESPSAPQGQDVDDCDFRAVAGIGAAVHFQDHRQFSKSHWSAIQRYVTVLYRFTSLNFSFRATPPLAVPVPACNTFLPTMLDLPAVETYSSTHLWWCMLCCGCLTN